MTVIDVNTGKFRQARSRGHDLPDQL